jgi:uncharacterized membrane protein
LPNAIASNERARSKDLASSDRSQPNVGVDFRRPLLFQNLASKHLAEVFILSYALRLVRRIAEPISQSLHLDHLVGAGIGTVTILSVAVLVLISFAGGVVARTAAGRRITRWSESSFLGRFPHYQVLKSMAEGLAHIENASGLKPVLVNIEDPWQIGYLLEQLENDWVVVFLPQAPSPMSGNVMYIPAGRVRPLDITMVQAMSIVKAMGVGSSAALRGVDLRLPSADD